jgi:protein-disulfide isomerase
MNLKTGLATALVAAVVAALVTAATIVLVWRLAPGVVNVSSLDEKKVVDIIRDYLTKNPEILVEMTTELDKRQAAEQAAQQQKVISENAEALFRSPLANVAGNPNGDVTVVEFFDYNCGFCRRALPEQTLVTLSSRRASAAASSRVCSAPTSERTS